MNDRGETSSDLLTDEKFFSSTLVRGVVLAVSLQLRSNTRGV